MGICNSCLGREKTQQPDETDRLLYNDDQSDTQSQHDYGAAGDPNDEEGYTPDPEMLRRQQAALQVVCSETQHDLIDIVHHDPYARDKEPGMQYSHLLNKLVTARRSTSEDGKSKTVNPSSTNGANGIHEQQNDADATQEHSPQDEEEPDDEADEAAWLESALQGGAADDANAKAGPDGDGLVVDLIQPESRTAANGKA